MYWGGKEKAWGECRYTDGKFSSLYIVVASYIVIVNNESLRYAAVSDNQKKKKMASNHGLMNSQAVTFSKFPVRETTSNGNYSISNFYKYFC